MTIYETANRIRDNYILECKRVVDMFDTDFEHDYKHSLKRLRDERARHEGTANVLFESGVINEKAWNFILDSIYDEFHGAVSEMLNSCLNGKQTESMISEF